MDTELLVAGFLAAAVRVATPLVLAATGETITERSGVINLGLEGIMLAGALAATLGATAWGPWSGVACAMVAGMLLAAVFALLAVGARADQIITGTAITLAALGLTGTLYRQAYGTGGAGLTHSHPQVDRPAWSSRRYRCWGRRSSISRHRPISRYSLFRSSGGCSSAPGSGLALRATGEGAAMARTAGVRTNLIRSGATVVGGGFAGLAGASLVLAQVGFVRRGDDGGPGISWRLRSWYWVAGIRPGSRWVRCSLAPPPRSSICFRPWGSMFPTSFSSCYPIC